MPPYIPCEHIDTLSSDQEKVGRRFPQKKRKKTEDFSLWLMESHLIRFYALFVIWLFQLFCLFFTWLRFSVSLAIVYHHERTKVPLDKRWKLKKQTKYSSGEWKKKQFLFWGKNFCNLRNAGKPCEIRRKQNKNKKTKDSEKEDLTSISCYNINFI